MNYFLFLALILFVYMSLWFIVSILKQRNDVADIAWGLGFVLLAWSGFILGDFSPRALLVNIIVSIWGTRLALHIHARNRGKPEDYRYIAWRNQWGKWFYLRSFLQVYLLQGIFLYLISLPVLFINQSQAGTLGIFDYLGLCVWLIGFHFESAADAQLARFIKNPANKGKLLKTGLWRYSRHPNYFGEVTQWWGIFIMALSIPAGFITIIGPLTITTLIIFVSGIPLLEKKYALRKDFKVYKKETSMFFPLPPKSI